MQLSWMDIVVIGLRQMKDDMMDDLLLASEFNSVYMHLNDLSSFSVMLGICCEVRIHNCRQDERNQSNTRQKPISS